jgi:hypothetical protein
VLTTGHSVATVHSTRVEILAGLVLEGALAIVSKFLVAVSYFALVATVAWEGLVLAVTCIAAIKGTEVEIVAVAIKLAWSTARDLVVDAAYNFVAVVVCAVIVIRTVDERHAVACGRVLTAYVNGAGVFIVALTVGEAAFAVWVSLFIHAGGCWAIRIFVTVVSGTAVGIVADDRLELTVTCVGVA